VITEGESDTAALLDMGFAAIGRPSCTGGVEIIKKFLHVRRDVVIIADCDEAKLRPDGSKFYPGQEGAQRLADAIGPLCKSLKVITLPGSKDVRQFYRDGGTAAAIKCIADNTKWWKE
jgi:DNA primase